MIKLTLIDGSVREIEAAQPAAEIIKGIGMGLYKAGAGGKAPVPGDKAGHRSGYRQRLLLRLRP